MNPSDIQKFWNNIGSTKDFTDPFFENRFSTYVKSDSKIIEYGCGYGRILDHLSNIGYQDLNGFDFAPKMIERGNILFPKLQLKLINESGTLPLDDHAADAAILSTVLCCNPDKNEQNKIINEIYRILNKDGVLYLCDFLITNSENYLNRYTNYALPNTVDFGIYLTKEGALVRHHTTSWLLEMLKKFDIQWLEQFDYITMNGNPVRTIHLIAKKL